MSDKKYRVVCYMRIDPEEDSYFMSFDEAKKEVESLKLMQPENVYAIEPLEDEDG